MKKNKKLIIKLIVLTICLILILVTVNFVLGRFKSTAVIDPNIETAFYIFKEDYQSMSLNLSDIYPREEPFIYTFSISNTDGENITETYLDYDLRIVTTTNLPLTYELYMNEEYNSSGAKNIIINNIIDTDEYGTYLQTFETNTQTFGFEEKQTNIYQLVVYFPEEYKDIIYQNIMEGITIKIESKQKI